MEYDNLSSTEKEVVYAIAIKVSAIAEIYNEIMEIIPPRYKFRGKMFYASQYNGIGVRGRDMMFVICGHDWDKTFDPSDKEIQARLYRLLCVSEGLSLSKAYRVICQAHKWYADRLAGIKRLKENNAKQLAKLHDEIIPEIAFEALGKDGE